MYPEDELLPLSAVADFTFCPRRAALHRLEQVWQENVATAEGHLLHDRAHEGGAESRGAVRIARSLQLRSLTLGLCGVADAVEFHRVEGPDVGAVLPGTRGRWQPFPVEYKRGIQRRELSFEIQLCAQAICLEEMLNVSVPAGALFYGLSKRREDVTFDMALREQTKAAAQGLHELIAAGRTPPATYEAKCKKCSLLSLCLPHCTGGSRSARQYVALESSGD